MRKAKLLWIDLEMTGLDPEKDQILELAAIATNWDLGANCRDDSGSEGAGGIDERTNGGGVLGRRIRRAEMS